MEGINATAFKQNYTLDNEQGQFVQVTKKHFPQTP